MKQTIEERANQRFPAEVMCDYGAHYDGYVLGATDQRKIDEEQSAKELLYAVNKTAERTRKEVIDKADKWLRQHAISVIKFGVGDIIRLKGSLAEYTITSISDGAYHGNGWKIDFDCEDDYELVEAADPTEALSVINIEAFRKAMEK